MPRRLPRYVDGAGDLDVFLGNYLGEVDHLWISDGNLGFTLDTQISQNLPDQRTRDVAAIDLDGDGDIDFVAIADIVDPNRVHLNQ